MEIISNKICIAAIVVLVLLQNSVCNIRLRNNVCSSYVSYFDRQHSKNCWYNPDAFDNVETIVTRRGYPLETHYVTTKDGYILRVFRIPHGVGYNGAVQRKPILVMHGWGTNSALWVDIGKDSLAFLLADAGFDVWLSNYRGSYYSNQHVNLTTKSPGEYWNFSVYELGIYDIPALLDYIYTRIEGREKIIIIGYSLGSTSSLVYGSLLPKHSFERVKVFILIAPVTCLTPTNSPLRYIYRLRKLMLPLTTFLFGHHSITKQFFPHGTLQMLIINNVCLASPLHMRLCMFLVGTEVGYSNFESISPEYLAIFLNQCELPGFSMKLYYLHNQMLSGNKFQMYDYGSDRNKEFYNSTKVPQYPLENIQVPVYSIIGTGDFAASVQDVEVLYGKLRKEVKKFGYYVVPAKPEFAHIDYIISKHAKQYIGNHIIEFINSHIDNS